MPEYKLIYFNARGRAELIRWICVYADISFNDDRIEMKDWPARKPTIPGGKLPVLMVDGEPLVQSLAIARYMAKLGGLVPEDDFEAAQCDAMADTFSDMMTEVFKVLFAPGVTPEQENKFDEEVYPKIVTPVLTKLEERLTDREYFSSNKMTWIDLMMSLVFTGMMSKKPVVLKGFPKVEAHIQKVKSNPKIKAWNEKQPEMPF